MHAWIRQRSQQWAPSNATTAAARAPASHPGRPIQPATWGRAGGIRAKLAVGDPGDSFEQEADRIAGQVTAMPEPRVQRACACGGTCPRCRTQPGPEPPRLQTKQLNSGDPAQAAVPPVVNEVLRSPGRPLDPGPRAFMESRFGHDFGHVRVHADARAGASAQALEARAYTAGGDVVFAPGQYAPDGAEGRRLLAHELTHVVQQGTPGTMPRDVVMRQAKPAAPRYSGCSATQQQQIDAAVVDARKALSRAAAVVGSAYGKPSSLSAANKQLLLDHFHTTSHDHLRRILGTYISVQRAFDAGLKLECEATCPKSTSSAVCGYAYNTRWFGGRGPIHICFDPAGCDFTITAANNQAALVIHEAAHRHAGVDDKVYAWDAKYATLTAGQSMDNADSYAWFAVSV